MAAWLAPAIIGASALLGSGSGKQKQTTQLRNLSEPETDLLNRAQSGMGYSLNALNGFNFDTTGLANELYAPMQDDIMSAFRETSGQNELMTSRSGTGASSVFNAAQKALTKGTARSLGEARTNATMSAENVATARLQRILAQLQGLQGVYSGINQARQIGAGQTVSGGGGLLSNLAGAGGQIGGMMMMGDIIKGQK